MRARRDAALLLLATFALYASALPPRSFGVLWSDDGMHYARWVVDGNPAQLAHPHHVLFHFVAYAVAKVVALGGAIDILASIRAHQLMSALGGAVGVACTYLLARRAGAGTLGGLAAAAFVATAFPYAAFASVPETYAPAHAWLAALFAGLAAERRETPWRCGLVGPAVLVAGAMVTREDTGLFLPAYALGVLGVHGFSKGMRRGSAIAALGLGLTTLAYFVVYSTCVAGTEFAPEGWRSWLAGYQEDGRYGISEHYFEERLPLEWRAFAEGCFPLLATLALGVAIAHAPLWLPPLWIALLVATLLASRRRALLATAGVYLTARLFFYAWWEAGQLDFEFGHLAAAGFVLALAAAAFDARRPALGRAFAAALGVLALAGGAAGWLERRPLLLDEGGWVRVQALDPSLRPGEAVAGIRLDTRVGFLAYRGREVLELDPRSFPDRLRDWIEAHPADRSIVLFHDDLAALADPARPEWQLEGEKASALLLATAQAYVELLGSVRHEAATDAAGAPIGERFFGAR